MTNRDRTADDEPGAAGTHGPPEEPFQLGARSWWRVLVRTVWEFDADHLFDWAAALTYYTILSIFPGLLLLVSVLGLVGQSVIDPLLDNLRVLTPEPARDILEAGARSLTEAQGTAGIFAFVGAAGAFWSASGYVGAFMSASNIIYDVPEGRPLWKTVPIRLAITVVIGVMLVLSVIVVVFTGRFADAVGSALGAGSVPLTIWNYAKWPVLLVLVSQMFALLYWASPNARQGGFRWISPGGLNELCRRLTVPPADAYGVATFYAMLAVEPRRKDKFLYEGRIWIDAQDFAVVRLEAKPAKDPSFWTRSSLIEQVYTKVGQFWLPLRNHSVSAVRLGGTADLTIQYKDYRIGSAEQVKNLSTVDSRREADFSEARR